MNILIVEDEFVSLEKLSLLLKTKGEQQTATSGEKGYELFCRAFEHGTGYDLVTLDIDLPGLSGPETLLKIRAFETEHGITSREQRAKVLMVTGKEDCKSVMASYQGGCDGYLTKPFNKEKIQQSLAEIGL